MTNAIETRDLGKTYRSDGTEVHALRGVELDVPRGEFVAVLGPSGCGKSTLLNLIGGLARPTAGSVAVNGRDLAILDDKSLADHRRHDVGFVFQLFNLVPVLSVEENVALPAVIAGVPESTYRPRVDELIDAVGLSERKTRLPSQLSGGEQQRSAVARALILEPSVLLADEPTGNLDSSTGGEVMALFKRFHDAGQTIVLVTHDAKVAGLADRVIFMRDGRLVREARLGEPSERADVISRLVELDA